MHASRRGLTLLELMLALVVTSLIAGAIAGMMGAVSSGISARRDSRSTMVSAHAASARLSAYIGPSRCILASGGTNVILWLHDDRESGTVHATEVRWLLYHADSGTIDVHFVSFPDGWSQAAKDLEDREYASDANWMSVLTYYEGNGWTAAMPLVDRLSAVSVATDQATALESRHASYSLTFETIGDAAEVLIAATVRLHQPPEA